MADRVVVLTGGLSGIGAATAIALARPGTTLALWDRSTTRQDEVLAAVRAAGGTASASTVDIRDPAAVDAAAAAVLATAGRIDVLVACAGIADQSTVDGGDPDRWRAVVETNVLGTMFCVRAVLPAMRRQRDGHVVLVASVSGRETYVGEPAYIASKWAVVGFGHALRQEVMDDDVRVTLVEPGIVDTPLTRDNPVIRPELDACVPLRPEDVAAAIAYACDQPAHVAVSELTVRPQRQRPPSPLSGRESR